MFNSKKNARIKHLANHIESLNYKIAIRDNIMFVHDADIFEFESLKVQRSAAIKRLTQLVNA